MGDHSLMNPDHLQKEINALEATLLPEGRAVTKKVCADTSRIIDYVRDTYDRGEPTTLAPEQVADLIRSLSYINMISWRYTSSEEFAIKVYKRLQKDRRWIIASKLKFLKK